MLSGLTLTTNTGGKCYLHFIDKKSQAPRRQMIVQSLIIAELRISYALSSLYLKTGHACIKPFTQVKLIHLAPLNASAL